MRHLDCKWRYTFYWDSHKLTEVKFFTLRQLDEHSLTFFHSNEVTLQRLTSVFRIRIYASLSPGYLPSQSLCVSGHNSEYPWKRSKPSLVVSDVVGNRVCNAILFYTQCYTQLELCPDPQWSGQNLSCVSKPILSPVLEPVMSHLKYFLQFAE